MRLGMVGLGRMGGNMSIRLLRRGHEVVGYARSEDSRNRVARQGGNAAASLEELVAELDPPRVVWVMVPSGDPTESTVARLGELLQPSDIVVDGGNSLFRDSIRRAAELTKRNVMF